MKFIENIKDYLGKRKLNRLLVNSKARSIFFCNLNKASNVGLIASVKDEEDYKKIINFIEYLKGDIGIRKVNAITFYNEKEIPSFLQTKLSFDFFTSEDLSWNREPLKDACKNFMKEDFDILIDLTDDFIIPLRNILAKSKASFKVGKYSEDNEAYYDFMIDSKHNNFHQFTKEAVRYLTIING